MNVAKNNQDLGRYSEEDESVSESSGTTSDATLAFSNTWPAYIYGLHFLNHAGEMTLH